MKKLFTILCAATLTFSVSAQAQFGAIAGLNSSAIGTSDSEMNALLDARIGMHVGAIAHLPLGDVVELRTGAIYSQKGATINFLGMNATLALDYLDIPIDFAFKLGDNGFALSAGSYIGLLMSSKLMVDGNSEDLENASSMDFGLNFGASYLIGENVLIGTKYGMGLKNLSEDSTLADDYIELNGVLMISVGYMFGG